MDTETRRVRRMSYGTRGRDWSDPAKGRGAPRTPVATRSGSRKGPHPGASEEQALSTP